MGNHLSGPVRLRPSVATTALGLAKLHELAATAATPDFTRKRACVVFGLCRVYSGVAGVGGGCPCCVRVVRVLCRCVAGVGCGSATFNPSEIAVGRDVVREGVREVVWADFRDRGCLSGC